MLGVEGCWPHWKYVGLVRGCFDFPAPPKMSHSFIQYCCCITASFTSSGMTDLCQKWNVTLIFQGAYGTGCQKVVECTEIIDVRCNMKQFDGLTWLTLNPRFYDRSTPLTNKLCAHDCLEASRWCGFVFNYKWSQKWTGRVCAFWVHFLFNQLLPKVFFLQFVTRLLIPIM